MITTPAGSIDGPLFVSVIVYVVEVPAEIEATPSVLAIARSAAAVTWRGGGRREERGRAE